MRTRTKRGLMIAVMVPAAAIGFLVELWAVGYRLGKKQVDVCFDRFAYKED